MTVLFADVVHSMDIAATVVLPIRVGWVVVVDHKPGRR